MANGCTSRVDHRLGASKDDAVYVGSHFSSLCAPATTREQYYFIGIVQYVRQRYSILLILIAYSTHCVHIYTIYTLINVHYVY